MIKDFLEEEMNKISKKLSVIMLAFALAITTFVPMFGNEVYAEQGTKITSESEATSQVDNSTVLGNGKYDNTKFKVEFFGGTGKAKWSCNEINVRDGKAFAKFEISSKYYTHLFSGYAKGNDDYDMTEYYDPDADKILKDSVYKIENKTVEIPVNLNKKTHFAGRSAAMTEPHWIRYAYEIKIEEKPAVDQYKPINYTGMFKVIDAYMTKEGNQEFMNITLSGDGYDYLFKGKYDEAVATGDDSSKWIGFTKRTDEKNAEYTNKDGEIISDTTKDRYEYKIPVNSNDNFIPVMSRSKSKKIWFPRYIEINRQTKELYAGDYYENNDLKLVNNDKIKADSAQLYVVGVEASNNYSATVIAKMPNDDFDKAKYVPARTKRDLDKLHDTEEEVALNGDNQFKFVFEKKSAYGEKQPVNKISNHAVKVSFHSKTENKWYDIEMMLDTKTMTFTLGKKIDAPEPPTPTPTPNPGENPSVNPSEPQIEYYSKDNEQYNVTQKDGVLVYRVGKSTGAAFRIANLHIADLDTVKIKGQGIEKTLKYGIDYTAKEGSIIVDIKKSFLDTLPNGKYDVLIGTKHNGEFAKSISIENSKVKMEETLNKNKNVKTGDSESMLIYSMILMGTLISAFYVVKRKEA